MKLGIKLNTFDKIALGVAGVVVGTIGIIPSAIGGGVLYHYRDRLKEFMLRKVIQEKVENFISLFKKND